MPAGINRNVLIIGGGTMGVGIAAIFSAGGWTVHIVESDPGQAAAIPQRLATCLDQLGSGLRPEPDVEDKLDGVAWDTIGLVIECVPEDLGLKQQTFALVENFCRPDALVTSNSSSFPISVIAEGLSSRNRMAGLHFFMPAHLIPLVEVISGEHTDPAVAMRLCELMASLGKRPVHVRKDIPGFLANRIQHALMREALALAEEGIASPEDIDAAVQYGFGMRYLGAGPFLQKDIAGLDVHHAAATTIYPSLCNDDAPAALLRNRVEAGHLGMKTGKGFFEWTEDTTSSCRAKYEQALIRALKAIKG